MQDEATAVGMPRPGIAGAADRSEIDRSRETLASDRGRETLASDRSREILASDRSGGTLAFGEHPPFGQRPRFGQRPHVRLLLGMRKPANWLQLVRFGIVGGSGFVVNIAVYALCVHAVGVDYRVSSVVAWLIAVLNNFVLNRHWTFDAAAGSARLQGVRFFIVSLVAEGFSLLLLTLLVEDVGLEKVVAQALAVAAVMPLNFLGNKLWSFRAQAEVSRPGP